MNGQKRTGGFGGLLAVDQPHSPAPRLELGIDATWLNRSVDSGRKNQAEVHGTWVT